MKKALGMLILTTMLLVNLAACNGKSDMPMEVEVDGVNIVLGQTTIEALTSQGYTARLSQSPASAGKNDKYLPFTLSLDKGAGEQIYVSVYVPYNGGTNINAEKKLAVKEGIIYSVFCTPGSTKKIKVFYNGVEIQELTVELMTKEWGLKPVESTSLHYENYILEAKNGTISVEAEKEKFKKLTVKVSYSKFLQLQK